MTPSPFSRAYRVLIIDDSANIHDDIRKILAPMAGTTIARLEEELFGDAPAVSIPKIQFAIDSAFQGDDGIALAARAKADASPYALAFVDMRMPPGMDGLGTIEQLWEIDPHIQVVICSAYSDYSWAEIISRLGRNDRLVILRKPFENIEVLQLAHSLTEKWNLYHQLQRHLNELENVVAERTRELHRSEALSHLILDNAHDLITVCDSDFRRVYSSPSYHRVLGYSAQEMEQADAFSYVHSDDLPSFRAAASRVSAGDPRESLILKMANKEKSLLHFEVVLDSTRDQHGGPSMLIITARDITDRQHKEIQTRLHQKLESIGLLAAGVAHEINTPTQFISDNARFLVEAFAQMKRLHQNSRELVAAARTVGGLEKEIALFEEVERQCEIDYLESEVPRTLEQSLEGLDRVAKIVRSLKEFSHPGSATRTPVNLKHTLENAATVCRHEWKYVADLETHFDPLLPMVPCLVDELNQAILNLIINAAHAIDSARAKGSSEKGKIVLRTSRTATHAVIEISDTGTGIPEAIRQRIFEPFFTTKPLGKGTGQGLALARSVIVGKHQGLLDFSTEVGKGTRFFIHLPLVIPTETKVDHKAA